MFHIFPRNNRTDENVYTGWYWTKRPVQPDKGQPAIAFLYYKRLVETEGNMSPITGLYDWRREDRLPTICPSRLGNQGELEN